ncbi:hypothetical protein [Arthrobacter sp. HY1533]|uniref:hypothetical protein n=1 Tax=Arthrobacter sp. HY1533 TaxID=2970919 RepID=UPI0022B9DE15|nr:hypothetical protein [Arthrobacter sp. HY1533]
MTKLIALAALLAALAWGVTATASWISKRKAPRAIGAGGTQRPVTNAEVDRAMLTAQLRTAAGVAFALLMFTSLFRVSVGLSGQAGLTAVLTASLSASGGLLLFSALPARKLDAPTPLLAKRSMIAPAAILLAFAAFITAGGLAGPALLAWQNGAPALLTALAMAGSAVLVLQRLKATASLSDPRMASLDSQWRRLSARDLTTFTSGALLASLGGTALAVGWDASGAGTASPIWTTACLAGGAALAAAGVVLLVLSARGALTLRTRAKANTHAPATAG